MTRTVLGACSRSSRWEGEAPAEPPSAPGGRPSRCCAPPTVAAQPELRPPTPHPARAILGHAVSLASLLVAACGLAAETTPPVDVPKLVAQLGDDSPKVRDEALEALAALGDKATPALAAALEHEDPEVRWRAGVAVHRIRWKLSAKLLAGVGDLMDGFESQPRAEREVVCRDLALGGLSDAVPTLKQILTADPSKAVRQAAARALVLLGDEGLKALLDSGVKMEGLDRYTVSVRIHIGNSYLDRGDYEKALAEYEKAKAIEPRNSIVHYNVACTYSEMKQIEKALDALELAVECGYSDVAWMEKDEDLDNLRDEPRYKALVQRLREQKQREE